jgi:hypothetical protein
MLYEKLDDLHILLKMCASFIFHLWLLYFSSGLKIYWLISSIFSLGTTISPWIVTLDALKPFTCEAPKQVSK